ncbi:MAG TPA: hypothetical protein VIL86_16105 [Tepidisphaeraceae bacterium]|jgi:hypothetical protein
MSQEHPQEPHECEPEDVASGIEVVLDIELLRPLCPQLNDRQLRVLIERHAVPIAAHMVSAGMSAAAQLFNGLAGSS